MDNHSNFKNINQKKVEIMNKENPRLSVIVPVYKTEHLLKKCVDSIANQTYSNLEIILVDDGSPDGSPALCDTLAKQYECIKVVHKTNGGVSSARNEGLKHATGEFVTFVDSDDYILPDYYGKSMVKATSKTDLVVAGLTVVDDNKKTKIISPATVSNSPLLKDHTNFMQFVIDGHFDIIVNKIYRKSLITSNFPMGLRLGEDRIFNLNYFKNIKGEIEVVNNAGYMYIFNTASACHQKRDDIFETLKVSLEELKNFLVLTFNTFDNPNYFKLVSTFVVSCIKRTPTKKQKWLKQTLSNEPLVKEYLEMYHPEGLKEKLKFFLIKHKQYKLLAKLSK